MVVVQGIWLRKRQVAQRNGYREKRKRRAKGRKKHRTKDYKAAPSVLTSTDRHLRGEAWYFRRGQPRSDRA